MITREGTRGGSGRAVSGAVTGPASSTAVAIRRTPYLGRAAPRLGAERGRGREGGSPTLTARDRHSPHAADSLARGPGPALPRAVSGPGPGLARPRGARQPPPRGPAHGPHPPLRRRPPHLVP